ncbi:MAG TPA: hypothetical protein ENI17_04910 [Pseudomonas xinjiangensis]|uniref:Uncharacterized protein n=2 Tax=root TaxID=1 RepID=A0A7V1BKK6_9GAMM|nr:hypothetical protein [Halopseudomonas xinjiangensis]HEC46951.1 hypothetical protein [Halopseudomonas xinjiangensis]
MLPSAEEAAQALRDIAAIKARAAGFQDYHAESGQLLLWGAAYFSGFTLTALFPGNILLVWILVVVAALVVGTGLARHTNPDIPGIAWRYLTLIASILLFCIMMNLVMWPLPAEQSAMIAPLFVATLYIIRGVQLRPRYLLIGLVLGVLSTVGFLFFQPIFWWWMALACGGTLMLSGLWLRQL